MSGSNDNALLKIFATPELKVKEVILVVLPLGPVGVNGLDKVCHGFVSHIVWYARDPLADGWILEQSGIRVDTMCSHACLGAFVLDSSLTGLHLVLVVFGHTLIVGPTRSAKPSQ